jgi:selenocysteine lyase/cysteine desulfurase
MAMRKALNEQLPNQGHFFNADHATARFTPAGPDHAQIASVNGVIDYFEAVYSHHSKEHDETAANKAATVMALFQQAERANLQPLLDFLVQKPGIKLIGKASTENRAPTVSFTVAGRRPEEVAAGLASQKIGIANGNCYAWRLMEALEIPPDQGVVRLSFVHYTQEAELQRLIEALDGLL